MSTSSKAFEKLLTNEGYFNKKMENFLRFKGNPKKTGEAAAEFLCRFGDKRSDIVQVLESIDKIYDRIETMITHTEDGEVSLEEESKKYLFELFELFKIDHKVFLHCLDGQWEKAKKKIFEMSRKRGNKIVPQFGGDMDSQFSIATTGCYFTLVFTGHEKTPFDFSDETPEPKELQELRKVYTRQPKEFRKAFPIVADYFDGKAPSSKKRRPNPTEDD